MQSPLLAHFMLGSRPSNGSFQSPAGKSTPSTPTAQGALVIDETGDRKDGKKTAHVGRQYLGSVGKVDNGVVSISG